MALLLPKAVAAGLTDQHAHFVRRYCDGYAETRAAEEAGFDPKVSWKLLRNPAIAAAIHAEVSRRIRVNDAPIANRVLCELVQNKQTPHGVRAKCAIALLGLAGHVAPKAIAAAADEKDLAGMSQSELLDAINDLESELAARAKPVNATTSALMLEQDADIFD